VKTQVAIVGAGPAGLLLGHLLRQAQLDVVILERRSAEYVLGRVRAGVLEQTTTQLLERLELGARMRAEGLIHDGVNLSDGERLIHIDLVALTGKHVTVYGQTEITRDLIDAAPARGLTIIWEAADVALHDIESGAPFLTYAKDGTEQRVDARFVAGCDGFYGPSRRAIPASIGREFERTYPFGWLGVLADVPPCHEEVVYANHENGFALASMGARSRRR
jgi:p-hydroxybenzoate 3-monooxygenase